MDYSSLTVTGLIFRSFDSFQAVGIQNKTIEIKNQGGIPKKETNLSTEQAARAALFLVLPHTVLTYKLAFIYKISALHKIVQF